MSELHFTLHHALTLAKQHVLEGHGGCVNRVTWSLEGDKLLSGSDDKKVRFCMRQYTIIDGDLNKFKFPPRYSRPAAVYLP